MTGGSRGEAEAESRSSTDSQGSPRGAGLPRWPPPLHRPPGVDRRAQKDAAAYHHHPRARRPFCPSCRCMPGSDSKRETKNQDSHVSAQLPRSLIPFSLRKQCKMQSIILTPKCTCAACIGVQYPLVYPRVLGNKFVLAAPARVCATFFDGS